jgi:hypothetical protein
LGCLPLDVEIWVVDLLSRIFDILRHVNAPDVAEDLYARSSFLSGYDSQFRCIFLSYIIFQVWGVQTFSKALFGFSAVLAAWQRAPCDGNICQGGLYKRMSDRPRNPQWNLCSVPLVHESESVVRVVLMKTQSKEGFCHRRCHVEAVKDNH